MIVANGMPRDTVAADENRCEICPMEPLPFLKRCGVHSMPEDVVKALMQCNALRILAECDDLAHLNELIASKQDVRDLRRATVVYRVMSPFILLTGALMLLAMLGQWWR